MLLYLPLLRLSSSPDSPGLRHERGRSFCFEDIVKRCDKLENFTDYESANYKFETWHFP